MSVDTGGTQTEKKGIPSAGGNKEGEQTMSIWMNRRRFMQMTSSGVVVGALSSVASRATAQSSGELRVAVGGGTWGQANINAYVKPFEAETGIKVMPITDDVSPTQLELMVTQNNVTIDVA
ncbi:twin-arginine translocation signal domain-containing protein, partial [Mesorhizobium sp. M0437]|uniref:twin-arginine translocation signal domain-containing protein n=1 Tax=Mesorhizobium sp. M0437 TaxID=2956945 RepID=UPI003336D487